MELAPKPQQEWSLCLLLDPKQTASRPFTQHQPDTLSFRAWSGRMICSTTVLCISNLWGPLCMLEWIDELYGLRLFQANMFFFCISNFQHHCEVVASQDLWVFNKMEALNTVAANRTFLWSVSSILSSKGRLQTLRICIAAFQDFADTVIYVNYEYWLIELHLLLLLN